jgi:hypothetical protein
MAETLRLTPSESVTIVSSAPEALVVEATYGPGGKPPPRHYHPAQDEHFEVVEGRMMFRLGSVERELAAGESIDIPEGVSHQVWNPNDAPRRRSPGRRGPRCAPSSGSGASTRSSARRVTRRRARSRSRPC